jgi:hypothetical protein
MKPFKTPAQDLLDSGQIEEPTIHYKIKKKKTLKEMWDHQYGEGTRFDLDYGKLIILALCIYIAVKVS